MGNKQNPLQSGAVVGRTIGEAQSGTVRLSALDQAQGPSEHTAPFDALIQLLEGEAAVWIAGDLWILRGGDISMPANEPPEVKAVRLKVNGPFGRRSL